jgi:hypothetical protein
MSGHQAGRSKQLSTGEENMTDAAKDHGEQKPENIEDLAPREDESAELKGGMSQENAHTSGGRAGRS